MGNYCRLFAIGQMAAKNIWGLQADRSRHLWYTDCTAYFRKSLPGRFAPLGSYRANEGLFSDFRHGWNRFGFYITNTVSFRLPDYAEKRFSTAIGLSTHRHRRDGFVERAEMNILVSARIGVVLRHASQTEHITPEESSHEAPRAANAW